MTKKDQQSITTIIKESSVVNTSLRLTSCYLMTKTTNHEPKQLQYLSEEKANWDTSLGQNQN
jgi:hypothetical protein